MKDDESLESTEVKEDFEEEESSSEPESIVSKPVSRRKTPLPEPESEEYEDLGNICPNCGEPQDHFTYEKKSRGWVGCPSCGKKCRRKEISEEFIRTIEPKTEPSQRQRSRDSRDDDYDDDSFDEDGEEIFNTPRAPHEILNQVLGEYGVREDAKTRIVSRVKRLGRPELADIDRMLHDFNTGKNKKTVRYIIEEYQILLDKEDERMDEYERDGTFPIRGSSRRSSERSGRYPEYSSRSRPRSRYDEPEEPRGISTDELLRILDERDRKSREREQSKGRDDLLKKQSETIDDLMEEIRDLRENPPETEKDPEMLTKADLQEMQNKSMTELLKIQLEDAKKLTEEIRTEMREDRTLHRQESKESRDEFVRKTERLQDQVRDEQKRADARPVGTWEKDETRLIAEGIDKGVDLLKERGSLGENIAKGLVQMQKLTNPQQPPTTTPPAEDEMTVADLMDPDFVR